MKTKKIPSTRYGFYFFERSKDRSAPLMLWPALWVEHRRQGLEISMRRLTCGWLQYRFHWYFGKVTPPSASPILSSEHGLDEFVRWGQGWSKLSWDRTRFDQWVQQSDWKTLIRWGGAKYHYSRIVLAKEFLAAQNAPATPLAFEDLEVSLPSQTAPHTPSSVSGGHDEHGASFR